MNAFVVHLTGGFAALVDKPPSEDQIGTGAAYLVLFLFLAAAVAFLGFSLSKQLRKTRANAEAGVFDKKDDQR
jgi:cbb3-type cytochrome oxidase subunit 3